MAEKRIKNIKSELLRELIGMYQPQSVGDITDMLKDLWIWYSPTLLSGRPDGWKRSIRSCTWTR